VSRASPQIRHLASLLVANEARGNKHKAPAAFPVFSVFGPHLLPLIGTAGFQALIVRACAVASREVTWLAAVHVSSDGSLEGFDDVAPRVTAEQLAKGETLAVAELLGLLIAFIGESLTLRMLRKTWPKLVFKEVDFCERAEK
jgi:hypothetical protein